MQLPNLPWEPCAAYLVLRKGNPVVVSNHGRPLKMCVVLEMHLDLRGLTVGCHDFQVRYLLLVSTDLARVLG